MKKVKRLIEIKRQYRLAEVRKARADKKLKSLQFERTSIVSSLTEDELRLYKDKIEKACR